MECQLEEKNQELLRVSHGGGGRDTASRGKVKFGRHGNGVNKQFPKG